MSAVILDFESSRQRILIDRRFKEWKARNKEDEFRRKNDCAAPSGLPYPWEDASGR